MIATRAPGPPTVVALDPAGWSPVAPAGHLLHRLGLFRELAHPREALANVTPNWFAAVMGTGVLAVAGVTLPVQVDAVRAAAVAVWALAALLLAALAVMTALHWRRHRVTARGHVLDPVMAHFYGAPPMAMMTVGTGALLVGPGVFGEQLAVGIDWVLWFAGTITGLASAAIVPYLMFTRHAVTSQSAFGGWLMPVVPPMVSASAGALLVPHAPAGQIRLTLLVSCYAMFGLSLLASVAIITLVWHRLAVHGPGPARMVPTLWIVLGPLGQSITAANLLGGVAAEALPPPYADALQAFGVVYGLPVWGFVLLWAVIAAAVTVRTARAGLPFSLTWWSFTFPVGTCVTGTAGLAVHTGAALFTYAAVIFYAGLVLAWLVVATRTTHGGLVRGTLFAAPVSART